MKTRRGFGRQLTLILLVVAIAACPLTIASFAYRPDAIASGLAQPPIQFTPDVKDLELTSVALTGQPATVVSSQPTFGPSQSYEEGSQPEVSVIEGGNREFGYGPSTEDPNVYLIWVTDEDGTHYYTVAADSEQLLGTMDEATNSRRENGFVHLIEERDSKMQEVIDQQLLVEKHQIDRMSWHSGAVGVALVGGLVCGIITGGACYIAFFGGALTAWVSGVVANGEKVSAQQGLESLEGQLTEIDLDVIGKYEQTVAVGSAP